MRFLPLSHLLLMLLFFVTASQAQQYKVETLIKTPFNASGGISVDDDGALYIADFGDALNSANGKNVYKVNKDGSFEIFATNLQGASGNDFDSQGNLFQSNIAGNRISKILRDGTVQTFASANIFNPVGIAVAAGDTVYAANCGSNTIVKITPEGSSSVFVSSPLLQCPNGLTIDNNGNLYTCNFGTGDIIKITPQKEVSVLATLPGGRCGHLTFANGVLYAVARCAHKVYEVSLNGDTALIAGSGDRGNDDGIGSQASFNHPNGIRASPNGDTLYINDAVSLDGDCTTVPLNPVVVRMIILNPASSTGEDESGLLDEFILHQNYPNPFNPLTEIKYDLPLGSDVALKVFDSLGREVKLLVDEFQSAGRTSITWDGSNNSGGEASSGIYFYQLAAGDNIITKKMLLLR